MPKVPTAPGNSIALRANIASTWTDAADPVSLSEFYRNGTNITNASNNAGASNFVYGNIPTSGQIKFSDFSGTGYDTVGSILFDTSTIGTSILQPDGTYFTGFTAWDTWFTWTVPLGVSEVSMVVIGGGGAGGAVTAVGGSQTRPGAGGGGGGLKYGTMTGLVGGQDQLSIKVGSGGVAGLFSSTGGGQSRVEITIGGTTKHCTANGGGAGASGIVAFNTTTNNTGGAGGSTSYNGLIQTGGGSGGKGGHSTFGTPPFGAGGGGAGGYSGSGAEGDWYSGNFRISGTTHLWAPANSGGASGGRANEVNTSYRGYYDTLGDVSVSVNMLPNGYHCGGATMLFGKGGRGKFGGTRAPRQVDNMLGSSLKIDPSSSNGDDLVVSGLIGEPLIPAYGIPGYPDMGYGSQGTTSNPGRAPSPGGGGAGFRVTSTGPGMNGGYGGVRIVWGNNSVNNTNVRRYPAADDVAGEDGQFPA